MADVAHASAAPERTSRRLRRLAPLVAVAAFCLAPGASIASASGVANFYRFTYQNATSAADAAKYTFMDLGYGSSASSQAGVRSLIASIHQSDPQTRLLLYKTASATSTDPRGIWGCATWNPSLPYGGIPMSWFLKNAQGVPMYDSTYHFYDLDPGNQQVQQSCLSTAISMAKQGGYNGVFWDVLSTSLFWAGISPSNCGSPSCQSDTNWHSAIGSFTRYVSSGLHAQGLLSFGNISGGAVNGLGGGPAYWQAFQQDGLDGASEESFTSGTNHVPVPLAQWTQGLANEAWNEAHGKYFLANADVTTNQALSVYGLATMLLAAQGRSNWSTAAGNTANGEYWFPQYDTALKFGQPQGAYTVQSNGLYVRRFQNGTAVVNPNPSAVTDPVYGRLGAQSGLILGGPPKGGAPASTNPSHPAKTTALRLSGLTYVGRSAGLRAFAGETSFFAVTARDANRSRLTYRWNWGDGTRGCIRVPAWTCKGPSVSHVYRRRGRYTVTVTVRDGAGKTVRGRMRITVYAAPPGTVFTVVRALGSSVATSSQGGGSVTSTLVLPSQAASVDGGTTAGACGKPACAAAVRRVLLAQVVKRNVKPGVLRLRVYVSNRPLVRQITSTLRKAHRHTLPGTFRIRVTLAGGRTVQVVQHLTLRF